MKKYFAFLLTFLVLGTGATWAQSGIIRGKVFNKLNNESVPFANVVIQGTTTGASTDLDGKYEIKNLQPGLYNLEVSYIGYETQVLFEIEVTNARPAIADFALNESATKLDEVQVTADPFRKTEESPVSLRSIGANEIRRNPGGNRDISRVIRSLPGVASTPSFRNDIIIRGGAPSENRYFLDGIEVPNINHFQTQGSSGGPVGLINVDFIKEVNFYSGAFPAARGNALSSVFDFVQKDGRDDKLTFNGIVGASDLGMTLEGPVGDNATFIFSVRRSYLQFLFKALGLPFLPIYNDYQFKYKVKLDDKNQLSIISLGALDNFELNLDANETEEQRYILNFLPVTEQWNYTIGAKYERFRDKGFSTLVLSRNMLNNTITKYANNDDSDPDNLLQDYLSQEIENKLRWEEYIEQNGFKISFGAGFEQAKYNVDLTQQVIVPNQSPLLLDFTSDLQFYKWAVFGTLSRSFWADRLSLSLGMRADANSYGTQMKNLLDQFSPRFSASYAFAPQWSLNFNAGQYYQLPSYPALGYRDASGTLVNQDKLKYLRSRHLVAGVERSLNTNTRITVEGFYKWYDQYPLSVEKGISLANLGADFGVIGNEELVSTSEGRSYGMEFLAQQKLSRGFYGIVAYTLVRSEFTDALGNYAPSSWDYRHLISLTGGKKFKKDWEIGMRWLFSGGAPFTPYNVDETVRMENWDISGAPVVNYQLLNSQRIQPYHQLDFRVDKKLFFDRWSLNLYFDVQNAYGYTFEQQDNIDVVRDANGMPVEDPNRPGYYQPKFLKNTAGITQPTLGIIVEL
ncbi:TonB-dependent receptor [Cytophagales bacterium LB-30]|uniref:TonB-dependent receptor n=1 Tax=Shiella aurantiaca TaxID=3058365 RepID=A0ABT8F9F2_9BACT|nr:TonB-dependent receptor [Shiella aurantiaca]MDN4166826.1 TonB-dependent receptor [Shiella aurantiaca]